MALAWYLTALSNDPAFRHVTPWKDFVAVRTDDFERAISHVGSDVIERTPRDGPVENDSSVHSELRTHKHSNTAERPKSSVLLKVQVSDFEMVCVLGIGSKGKVLLARQKSNSGLCAIKVISKRRVLACQELQRTLAEQAVLRHTTDEGINPFVVKLRRSFHDEDNLYLVMDFHRCGDLRTQLERWGSFSHDRSRFYAAEVVEGIEGLHAAGVIHRNLKPEHILIDKEGHIVLCGFGKSKEFQRGVAQSATSTKPPTGGLRKCMDSSEELPASWQSDHPDTTSTLCGTAAYFAPEVINGFPYSYEIDWWSFGTILYEMLIGIRPFDADNMCDMYDRILQDELQFPEDQLIDQHTKDFIRKLLQRDPAFRLSEPQIKCHPYFSTIDWSDVHHRRLKPPNIPPTDPSNPSDTQNFEEAFLNMKPVINDDIHVGTEQELGQTSPGSTDSEDPIATPAHSSDDTVDVFGGYSFRDRHPIVINIEDEEEVSRRVKEPEGGKAAAANVQGYDGPTEPAQLVASLLSVPLHQRRAPRRDKEEEAGKAATATVRGYDDPTEHAQLVPPPLPVPPYQWRVLRRDKEEEGGKAPAGTVPGYDDPTEYGQRLAPPLSVPPYQWRLGSTPVDYDTNAAHPAFPSLPIHVPAIPAFPAGTVVNGAMAAFAQRHNNSPRRPNVRRTRQEKSSVPVSDHPLSDADDDDDEDNEANASYGEGFDNCPPDSPNPNSGNHNGPPSFKTMSKRSNSIQSVTSTSTSIAGRMI
ncbi:kinase-like domain-containing protein [Russula compacta]|nr:kinase-like domain-containing protein [Russula compacta]